MLSNLGNWLYGIFVLVFLLNESLASEYTFRNPLNENELAAFFEKYNSTNLEDIFENAQSILPIIQEIISTNNFVDPNMIHISPYPNKLVDYNNFLALTHFYLGEIEYFGLVIKKQNLIQGFRHYLISSFFGNPQSLYKLYLLFESNIISIILASKDFDKQFQDKSNILSYIRTSKYFNYFQFTDEYERKAIATQFIYTASLGNNQAALTTLGYKYYKGYGVQFSCDNAQKYYKAASNEIVKEIYHRKRPSYYEKVSLEQYEYIGNKFTSETFEIDEIIDYFKVEAENGHVNYIQQLGQRYLYGQGVTQDFKQAHYYFGIGKTKNDSSSIYYLGEMFLNGWGVEKVK